MKIVSPVEQMSGECLLFLAGWGMDPIPFSDLAAPKSDLIFCYDYQEIDIGSLHNLSTQYEKIHLIAWSMGVWVGAHLFSKVPNFLASATAVNGTLSPIDERCGLSKTAYRAMLDNFSSTALNGFYDEMFSKQSERERFSDHCPRRSPRNIHRELEILYEQFLHHGPALDIYDRKIVGTQDRIFSARNQARAWGRGNCEILPVAHFPFYTWNGLIEHTEFK
ncbi:MAG: DUF452 family protein [Desulfobulbaceae bacterium]|nr:DUF452 family protein [Desulfobulbaceae bacterium]